MACYFEELSDHFDRMKIYTPDNKELLFVTAVERRDNALLISGKIMGTMPMKALVYPGEVRRLLKLLSFTTLLFLISLPLRRGTSESPQK